MDNISSWWDRTYIASTTARGTRPAAGVVKQAPCNLLDHNPVASADLQVLADHGATAHADIQQPLAVPDGVDAGHPLQYLLVRPILEGWSGPVHRSRFSWTPSRQG
jgi:hypothetical protein